MIVLPVSFGSCFKVKLNKDGVDESKMNNEVETAVIAREIGVNVPEYKISQIEYETKGEKADFYKNPITKEHFDRVLRYIYLLDKSKILHNDLDIEHVFYGENGEVEFDCFRFASRYNSKNETAFPEFMSPTNQLNYENASLASYVKNIYDSASRKEVIANYLSSSLNFHQKRVSYVDKELIDYEQAKIDALRNIDDDKIDLMLEKLDFFAKQRKAFTEWDEGNGACGHKFNPQRRINAIPMYFDAIKSAISYSKHAKYLSQTSDKYDKKYYEYEARVGEYFANTYIGWVKGMANYNFEDKAMRTYLDEKTRLEIEKQYEKIIDADFDDKIRALNEYLEIYSQYTK